MVVQRLVLLLVEQIGRQPLVIVVLNQVSRGRNGFCRGLDVSVSSDRHPVSNVAVVCLAMTEFLDQYPRRHHVLQ